nr:4-hydroxy-3-methylbut-2-enyl diphosphate reductase [Treponemataceae bacterium]
EKALDQYPDKSVYTLGPLIHNKVALKALAEKGLKILSSDEVSELDGKNSVVIIRAHGVEPKIIRKVKDSGAILIDATCPRVLSSQKRAADFAGRSFDVIIAGDKNHGEVAGIQGFALDKTLSNKVEVVENSQQAEKLNIENRNCMVLSQTTFSAEEYKKITDVLIKKNPSITILNTICSATAERQNALHDLCRQCQSVFVLGGKNSANTRRLYELAREHCLSDEYAVENVFHFEDIEEMKEHIKEVSRLLRPDSIVGITAGASTPESCINDLEKLLKSIF